jgi:hypothetical protein
VRLIPVSDMSVGAARFGARLWIVYLDVRLFKRLNGVAMSICAPTRDDKGEIGNG